MEVGSCQAAFVACRSAISGPSVTCDESSTSRGHIRRSGHYATGDSGYKPTLRMSDRNHTRASAVGRQTTCVGGSGYVRVEQGGSELVQGSLQEPGDVHL
ncbi:hypothetical protein GCM10010399_24940 [Dactylosporangium fulvum]